MTIKQRSATHSVFFKKHVNKYTFLGLGIAILSILVASSLAAFFQTGFVHLHGLVLAQKTNPALWALDLTPFLFAYWGQLFCEDVVHTMELVIENKTRELENKHSALELKLQYESNHDHLTKLPNQHLLIQRIKQGIEFLHDGEDLALIILHINDFKTINMKYGNFNANNLLIQFGEKLKSILLEPYLLQANMGMNMVARLQGAEFAVLFSRISREHHFDDLLTKILVTSSAHFMINGNSIQIFTSAGIAHHSGGDDETVILHHASSALFYAEKEGLSHATYDLSMEKTIKDQYVKEKALSDAIRHETLETWYQPYFDLKNNTIVGFISEIHLDDENDGSSIFDPLIPLLNDASMVKKATYLILKKAMNQLSRCHLLGRPLFITVPLFDATDVDLPSVIEHLLKEHSLDPSMLKVELTESVCLSSQSQSIHVLKKIAELGVRIGISDFGSGCASFTYLVNFPISEIRLDQSFVMDMMDSDKKLIIVKTIIKLAETMNLVVYADGILDAEILKTLKKMGCRFGRGSYFSSAVRGGEIVGLLKKG